MTMEERIEAAISALRPIVYGHGQRTTPRAEMLLRKEAEAAIRAAFPDLLDRTAWLAPMEPTLAMKTAGGSEHGYFYEDEAGKVYVAMRDAYLATA